MTKANEKLYAATHFRISHNSLADYYCQLFFGTDVARITFCIYAAVESGHDCKNGILLWVRPSVAGAVFCLHG